jgi:hypothetical protein
MLKNTATDIYKEFMDKFMAETKDLPPEFSKAVDDYWDELVGPRGRFHETQYLFKSGSFKAHSGEILPFKIECDALQPHSMETLCAIIASKYSFNAVWGVPTGGIRIARLLGKYCIPHGKDILIVDDVLTTGGSMEKFKEEIELQFPDSSIIGVVLFARGRCPTWVDPVFQMWEE